MALGLFFADLEAFEKFCVEVEHLESYIKGIFIIEDKIREFTEDLCETYEDFSVI
jgi:hypothetical protein